MFYTITNLQGSQTQMILTCFILLFYTITNLQGSQTEENTNWSVIKFYTITNLQGSQTHGRYLHIKHGFTPLQTYKVLKHYL